MNDAPAECDIIYIFVSNINTIVSNGRVLLITGDAGGVVAGLLSVTILLLPWQ